MKTQKQNIPRLVGFLIFANVILTTALYLSMGTDHPYFIAIIANFIGGSIALVILAVIANKTKRKPESGSNSE